MPFDAAGTKILKWVGCLCLPHRGHVLSWKRKVQFRLRGPSKWWTVQYVPNMGYWLLGIGTTRDPNDSSILKCLRRPAVAIKRRRGMGDANLPAIPLPNTSLLLAKCKLLREFLTETAYEDGSMRTPGYFSLRNKGTQFEVTVSDPDAALRLPCRGLTIDDAFALVEKLLGTEDAPWEHDQYLSEQLARKKKRKK